MHKSIDDLNSLVTKFTKEYATLKPEVSFKEIEFTYPLEEAEARSTEAQKVNEMVKDLRAIATELNRFFKDEYDDVKLKMAEQAADPRLPKDLLPLWEKHFQAMMSEYNEMRELESDYEIGDFE